MRGFQILLLALLASLGARECATLPETHPGDILLPTLDGRVVLFHPEKGAWEDYASLGNYMFPTDIAREASGDFLICDEYASTILRLNGSTGTLSVVSQGNLVVAPTGLAVGPDGAIYESDAAYWILRIDPATGDQTLLAEHGYVFDPVGVRLGPDGNLYVVDEPLGEALFRVDPLTGAQSLVTRRGFFWDMEELEFLQDGSILVSNWGPVSTSLIHVDPSDGAQTEVASGINKFVPGLARDPDGGVYLAAAPDPYSTTLGTLLRYDGAGSVVTIADFPFGFRSLYVFPGNGPVRTTSDTWGHLKGLYR